MMAVEVAGTERAREAHDVVAELFRAHHRSFVRTAYLLLGDRSAAEEAVQDAYVRVYRAHLTRGTPDAPEAYMRTAVVNACRSHVRGLVRRRRPARPAPAVGTPEDAAVLAEEHRAVIVALHRLPDRQRECLVLRYYLDLSEAETAAALGISPGSVKTHVHRGLASLSDGLENR